MTVNKLERFAQNADFDHVLEHTDYQGGDLKKPKGSWQNIFDNSRPVILELACGTGAYTLELARRSPDRNYVGIDIKGARIWKGAKQALNEELTNVRFLRIFIEGLSDYFSKDEVNEIWITFPDPYPRAGNRKKRLTSSHFLEMYANILNPRGTIHFKTDDTDLFDYTCREVVKFGGKLNEKTPDIYRSSLIDSRLKIQTVYEKRHLKNKKTISYCSFTF